MNTNKHTRSQRGAGGRFDRADGPKAKRIEVWLQPDTVTLLDTLCKQWSVGRGKVIDHFMTRGPVAPAAWLELEQVAAPPPTPSAPPAGGTIFDTPELKEMQAKIAAQWEVAKADAKRIGCKAEQVQRFKSHHKLPADRPLSADAAQLLQQELEAQSTHAKGESIALEQRLQRLQERATPERISQIAGRFDGMTADVAMSGMFLDLKVARTFLLAELDAVGIKQRRKLVDGVWADLRQLVPQAAEGEQRVLDHQFLLAEDQVAARCMFWGAVIRLWSNDGDAPEGTAEFLEWCGYATHQSHAERKANRMWNNFARTMRGNPSSDSDRVALGLPPEAELTRKGINDAYKVMARQHHPDMGGTAEQMHRINEARKRLLLEVG